MGRLALPETEMRLVLLTSCAAGGLSITLLKPPTIDLCLKLGGLVDVMAIPFLREIVQNKVQVKIAYIGLVLSSGECAQAVQYILQSFKGVFPLYPLLPLSLQDASPLNPLLLLSLQDVLNGMLIYPSILRIPHAEFWLASKARGHSECPPHQCISAQFLWQLHC